MNILPTTPHMAEALAVTLKWRREYPSMFTAENIHDTARKAKRAAWIDLDAKADQAAIDARRAIDAALPDPEPACMFAAKSRGLSPYGNSALRGD